MEIKHKCKLCMKSFMNGKALGGHMSRSHFTKLPLPPKTPNKNQEEAHITESTSTELSSKGKENEEKGVVCGLRKDPKKRFKDMDHGFLDAGSVMQDRESETESTRKPTRRRSKRAKRTVVEEKPSSAESLTELEMVNSVTASDEDVALCLLMLSRDFWRSDDSAELKLSQTRSKHHRCDTCNKVFKSSQALGSHRIVHGKITKKKCSGVLKYDDVKLHECPFCGKVFSSGQALGGHKRSHILSTSTITASCSSSRIGDSLVDSNSGKDAHIDLDLNLPAPIDDDDDDYDLSHQDISAVSDARFVANHVPTI